MYDPQAMMVAMRSSVIEGPEEVEGLCGSCPALVAGEDGVLRVVIDDRVVVPFGPYDVGLELVDQLTVAFGDALVEVCVGLLEDQSVLDHQAEVDVRLAVLVSEVLDGRNHGLSKALLRVTLLDGTLQCVVVHLSVPFLYT